MKKKSMKGKTESTSSIYISRGKKISQILKIIHKNELGKETFTLLQLKNNLQNYVDQQFKDIYNLITTLNFKKKSK